MAVRAEVLTDLPAIHAQVPAWRALLVDSASNTPFLTPEWLLTWWEVFGPQQGRQLSFFRVLEGERLIGLAPLLRRRHWYRPGLPFRRLEVLGSGEPEADAICSDYLNIIAQRGQESMIATALIGALLEGRLGGWDELVIPLMDGDGPMPELLATAARQAGLYAAGVHTSRAPYIPLPDSWEEYLRAVGQKTRYLINRSLREFDQWAAGTARLERASTPESLHEGKRILQELHQLRWQGTGSGAFGSPHFRAFHDRVMPLLLAEGSLELLWLTVRGEPIAALYNIVHDDRTYFYQCGRRLDVPKNIRPGGVIMYHAIRLAIEGRRREFDFLGGESRYKDELALASRPLLQLRLARPGFVESVRRWLQRGKELLRPLRRLLM